VPGEGVLARHGNLILLSSLEQGQFVDVLLDLLEQVAADGGDGREFADQVAAALESAEAGGDVDGGPSVLAFGAAGSGLAVTVGGGAWADVTTAHGTQRIEAGQPGMLLRCLLRSPVSSVQGGLGPAATGPAATDRFSRLDAGTVRANGLSFFAGGPSTLGYVASRPAAPAAPAAPAGGQPTQAVPQAAPEPVPQQPAAPQPVQPAEPVQPAQPAPVVPEPAPPQEVAQAPAAEPVQPVPSAEPVPAPAGPVGPAGTELWQPPPGAEPEREVTIPPDVQYGGEFGGQPQFAGGEFGGQPQFAEQPQGAPPAGPGVGSPAFAAEPFESVLLLDAEAGGPAPADLGVPQREPLARVRDVPPGTSSYVADAPIIQGVYCKNGHFDDPEALFCAVCGISMNQQTLINRPGTRPPLGVLLLDDGSVFQLDRDYIVGREPGLDATVASGRSRALRIPDDSGIVSRVHAKVSLDGWRVLVTDLGSANGTRIRLPKDGEQQLQPHVPLVLTTGSTVDLGGRSFRYESHRGR
jgi:outer membrane biosynthesis protein TonB